MKIDFNKEIYGVRYRVCVYAYGGEINDTIKMQFLNDETVIFTTEEEMLKSIIKLKCNDEICQIQPFTFKINDIDFKDYKLL